MINEQCDIYASMEELYEDNWKLVFVFLKDYYNSDDILEDFSSAVWVKVFEKQDSFLTMDKIWVKNYLRVMVKNMVKNHNKKQYNEKKAMDEYEKALKLESHANCESSYYNLEKYLEIAVDSLTIEEKQLIISRFQEELSSEEVGVLLGITAGAVRVRQHRVLKKLRDEIEKLIIEESEVLGKRRKEDDETK